MSDPIGIDPQKATKRELLALPTWDWDTPTVWWDALLIVPSRRKHDSGYACIAIIGVRYTNKGHFASHVLAWPDDIEWPAQSGIRETGSLSGYGDLRTDAYHPSGVLHLWSRRHEFHIGMALSSVTIELRRKTDV